MGKYPKGSELILATQVDDQLVAEHTLLKKFRSEFDNRTDIGAEYFEGDLTKMKEIIVKYALGAWSDPEDEDFSESDVTETIKMSSEEPVKSVTELREECRQNGLAIRGTREELNKKLELFHSIEKVPSETLEVLATSQGFKLTKKGKEQRIEYVKKALGVRKSTAKSEFKSETDDEGETGGEGLSEKVSELEARVAKLENSNFELSKKLDVANSDIEKLEALVTNLMTFLAPPKLPPKVVPKVFPKEVPSPTIKVSPPKPLPKVLGTPKITSSKTPPKIVP